MFPPLCYVDVSDDASVEENEDSQPEDNDLQNGEDSFDDEDTDGVDIDENQSEEDVETSFFLLEWLDWS